MAMQTSVEQLEARAFLTALLSSSDDPIVGKTLDGTVVEWNPAAERLYGYAPYEMIGQCIAVLIPTDRLEELSNLTARVAAGETVKDLETIRLRKDGTSVDVTITVSPVVGPDGAVLGASAITHDLSHDKQRLSDLHEARRRADESLSTLDTLQVSAPIGLGFVDRDFRYIHANQMLASLSGKDAKNFIGKTVAELVPDIWPQVESVYHHVLDRDEAVLNIDVSGPNPHTQSNHWLASYYPVHLQDEVIGIGIVVVDVTERLQAEEFRSIAMNQMAEGMFITDERGEMTYMNSAVTKLLGWTEEDLKGKHLHDVIHTFRADGSPILSEADCDHEKVRSEGKHMRGENDVYTCKDGSLLPIAYSAAPITSGSAGPGTVLVFRDISDEISERLRAKSELEALAWMGKIREALDENRMVLYSQPIIPLGTGEPSAELLIRMIGRAGEVISPDSFLGVAERYGLIAEIDRWVIGKGLTLAATGRRVGINVSAESMATPHLLEYIKSEMESSGANPADLVFEITETALMTDIEKGHAFARGIVELGSSVALDDFGTGYGTFTHVKKLPIKYLKIDIEFVRDLVNSQANQHVVQAVVNLATGFGCQTIAEGVEDEETLELLKEFGVDFVQGFYLGRPAPIE
jgi:PAS domain S-box-containing protein